MTSKEWLGVEVVEPELSVPDEDLPTITDIWQLERLIEGRNNVYLRFSRGPAADAELPSRDYESGLELPGLSVTPLSAPRWWTRPLGDWVARQICKYLDIAEKAADRRAWALLGSEVSRGPDHEPIVVAVKPVAWLADEVLAAARQRYEERFRVGKSSTGNDSNQSRETS